MVRWERSTIRMGTTVKTTVDLPDALLEEARELAAREKTTLREILSQALRLELERRKQRKPFKLRDLSVGGGWLTDEFKDATWAEILEASYGDRA